MRPYRRKSSLRSRRHLARSIEIADVRAREFVHNWHRGPSVAELAVFIGLS
jgi:hypothetical protein